MADYKSSHTGKRVDKAVSKIPAGGPGNDSALVKITGEESGEFVYLKDKELVFDSNNKTIGLASDVTKKIDKIDAVGNKIPANNASKNNSLIAVTGGNGRYIVLDSGTFSFDTKEDPNVVKINKLPTGVPTSANGALVKINNNGVGSYLYLNTNDLKFDGNNIQLNDNIKDSIDKADSAIPNKKPDKDQSFIILDTLGNGSYVVLDGKTVVLDKNEIKLDNDLQTKIKKIPGSDPSKPSLIKVDGASGSYVQLKDKQLAFDGTDIGLASDVTDKLDKIDGIDAKTAKIPSGNPSIPSVIVVAKDGTSKYVGSNGNVAVSDGGLNVNIDGKTIIQNGKQIAVNIDGKTIVSDANNGDKLKINTADDSITSTDKGIKVNANYIKGLIPDSPIEAEDLNTFGSPVANTYYEHTGYTSVSYKKGVIYFYDGTVYKPIDGNTGSGGTSRFDDFGLTQGQRKYSVVQKRVNDQTIDSGTEAPDEVCSAYQYGSSSFGGACQSGMTEDEFNAFYYDVTTSQPKNGGQGLVDGKPTDYMGRTYDKSRNYAFSVNAGNKALGRDSFAAGNMNETEALCSSVFGFGNIVTNVQPYSTTVGRYNKDQASLLFSVGDGANASNRSNALEVYSNGRVKAKRSDTGALDNVATESYVADKFVPTTAMGNAVYITSITGNNTVIPYGYEAALGRNSIALYNSDGTLKVTDAKEDNQAVTLKQLKEKAGNDLNLENGTGQGSLVQKNVKSSSGSEYTNVASGSGAVAFGKNTQALGNTDFVTGQSNKTTESSAGNLVGGNSNTVDGNYNLVGGNSNTVDGNINTVIGGAANVAHHDNAALFGTHLDSTSVNQLIVGSWNKLDSDGTFIVANGSGNGNRKHAIEINKSTNGDKVFYTNSDTTNRWSELNTPLSITGNLTAGNRNEAKGSDSFAIGRDNKANTNFSAAIGIGVETGNNNEVAIGRFNEKRTDGRARFTIGNGSETARNNIFQVLDNGSVIAKGAPESEFGVVRKKELDEATAGNVKNLTDATGTKAVNQVLNNSTTTIDVTTKNPNAYALDSSLANTPIGASGESSATFGGNSAALSKRAMAIGTSTVAKGKYSLAAGDNSVTLGNDSAAFGYSTVAKGLASFASGNATIAAGENAHTEGFGTKANGYATHAEGNLTVADGNNSHAEGISTQAKGYASHAEGNLNITSGEHAHAEGFKNTASGNNSHAEGSETKAVGLNSHTEGWLSEANGDFSHVEGYKSSVKTTQYVKPSGGGSGSGASGDAGDTDPSWTASDHRGEGSHASGILTQSSGYASHSEGLRTVADGHVSHAEGQQTYTTGWASHAEGNQTTAEGGGAHAEGGQTKAIGVNSHAEGTLTTATGNSAHAEGSGTQASGDYSHAAGIGTIANGDYQTVVGKYNDASNQPGALFVVGNGAGVENRKNAFTVNQAGAVCSYRAPVGLEEVVRLKELNTKLDKTGGTVGGNLTITGDLTVNGTEHINNVENLDVKSSMIYSNADGATLAQNGGIGIKKNATDTYGIVYDPTADSVKLGVGKADANGKFTFNTNEGNPVAIRADSETFTNNDIVKWDSTGNKLVSGGQLIDNVVGKDGIEITKATDSDKVEISGKNFVAKGTPSAVNTLIYALSTKGDTVFYKADNGEGAPDTITRYWDSNIGTIEPKGYLTSKTPTLDYQAANKKYVDDAISTLTLETSIIKQDLTATFMPVVNTYYEHTGTTTAQFTKGIIYLYNGTEYKAIDGSGSGTTGDYVPTSSTNAEGDITNTTENKDGSFNLTNVDTINTLTRKLTHNQNGLNFTVNDGQEDIILMTLGDFFAANPLKYYQKTENIELQFYTDRYGLLNFDKGSLNFESNTEIMINSKNLTVNSIINAYGGIELYNPIRAMNYDTYEIMDIKHPTESGRWAVEPTTLPTEQSLLSVSATGVHSWKKVGNLVDVETSQTIVGRKTFKAATFNDSIKITNTNEGNISHLTVSKNAIVTYFKSGLFSGIAIPASETLPNTTFALTPDTAPTEPSLIVTAADRTPTWKPLSELGGKALKVTIW